MPRDNLKLYVVFDTVSETVTGPILSCINDLVAMRSFVMAIERGEFPAADDYRLLRLGTISDAGDITAEDPAIILTGREAKETLKRKES